MGAVEEAEDREVIDVARAWAADHTELIDSRLTQKYFPKNRRRAYAPPQRVDKVYTLSEKSDSAFFGIQDFLRRSAPRAEIRSPLGALLGGVHAAACGL